MKRLLLAATVLFLVIMGYIVWLDEVRRPERLRVGLVLTGSARKDGWNRSHYEALAALAEEMDFELLVRENVSEFDDSCLPVIEELAGLGSRVISLAGMSYGDKLARVVRHYPKVYFLHGSGVGRGPNLTSFFGRMYQARYLSGLVAGLSTRNGRLGYVAAMPVCEVVRGVNAFTLGARAVNPEATVHVKYTGLWDNPAVERRVAGELIDRFGVDVMTYHQNDFTAAEEADGRGVKSIAYHVGNDGSLSERCLTAAVWRWSGFYRARIEESRLTRFQTGVYWAGLEMGMVDLAPFSGLVPEEAKRLVAEKRAVMASGDWDVFFGPIRDNGGRLRVESGSVMSDDDLLNHFDWYVEGVSLEE